MPKKASSGGRSPNAGIDETDQNVDKIRDILFGGQMRDYDKRFTDLEKKFQDIIDRQGKDIERRIERLDAFARRELDKLGDQLKAEKKDRIAEDKKAAAEHAEYADQVEAWFAEVEDRLSEEAKDIRESLHEQSKELSTQIRQAQEALQAELAGEVAELADKKLAREDLAALLTEVAMRLNKDFKLPKA